MGCLNPTRLLLVVIFCLFQCLNPIATYANFAAWDRTIDDQDPIQWLIKESEHFTITYPQANTVMADKALNIAERVHLELMPFFDQKALKQKTEKTKIVLVDDYDVSNGWATFYPFSQIRLFSSPPDSVSGLEVNDDWLHTLIRHEYVHILHLEMARGAPETLRTVFGRVPVFFPHTITPSFMLEGLATYLETNHELGYGRLQGSYYAMQMRTEVAEQRIKSLSDVSAPLRDLPLGMQYLYGSYFFQYLAQNYGQESIQAYLKIYSGQILPAIMQNSTLEKVLDKSFDEVWSEYQVWLEKKFAADIKQLKNAALQGNFISPESINLDRGLFKDAVNSHGSDFFYIHNNGEDTPELRSYSFTTDTFVAKTENAIAVAVNDQKDVVISRQIAWADGRSWADLFLLTEGVFGKQWQALTHKSRLRNVRWLNNELMIASRKVHGISELVLINKLGEIHSLWSGDDETTVIGDFDVAERSASAATEVGYIVAAVKRAGQGWNLERIAINKSKGDKSKEDELSSYALSRYELAHWQPITDTKAVENSPQILADGRILYSADYDGIYNIFLFDPATSKLQQLTHMLSGAFEPKYVQKDEKQLVIFQAYTADGFEFRQLDLDQILQGEQSASKQKNSNLKLDLADKQGRYNYPAPFTIDVDKTAPEPYSPWSSLLPRWWLPYYLVTPEATQVGLTTGGTDALARHNYSVSLGFDWENQLADMSFYYAYDNRYQFSFQRSHDYFDVNNDETPDLIIEQDRWIFARNHIFNALEDQLSLSAGIVVEREGSIDRDNLLSAVCITANGASKTCKKTLTGLGLKFDSREGYLNSPGFSSGRYVDLVYEHNEAFSGLLDSDYEGGVLQGQWQEVFDLPGRRSLSLHVLAAQADIDAERLTVGGEDRFSELSLFGRDDFALRGYPSSVQGGNLINVNRINYTQWLARIDKGWGIWPIGAGDISTDIYLDYGSAWQEGNSADYLTGIGIDFKIEVLAFYNVMLPIKLGFARGLDKELGEDRINLAISLSY